MRIFGSRQFLRLWIGMVNSAMGDWLGFFAIAVLARRVGGTSATGAVFAARIAPAECIGLDADPAAIDEARALAAERGITNARFDVGDVYALPYDDASFDAAFSNALLQHLADPAAAVREIYRVLKPGGIAVWVVKAFVRDKQIVDFPGDWRKLCEACGFETVLEVHASLVTRWEVNDLFDGVVKKERKRASFFRRLAESKGSPKIDYETVWFMRKRQSDVSTASGD